MRFIGPEAEQAHGNGPNVWEISAPVRSSHPNPRPEAPERSGGLEGGLQGSQRRLEGPFEAR
ncbi:hypothetical protein JCM16408A_22690 [Methylobacterium phyllosphaerae]